RRVDDADPGSGDCPGRDEQAHGLSAVRLGARWRREVMHGFMSERQRASFERAERERDKALAAGPPEPPTFDVMVEYMVWIDREECTLPDLIKRIGGEAHFASGRDNGWIEVKGSTLIEEVRSEEDAEEVLRSLLHPMRTVVDLDDLVIEVQDPTPDEPDWDAIAKDRRIEEDWA